MCYGIGNEKGFIEIEYNKKQYDLRISVDEDKYFETIEGEIILEFYNKVIEKLGNGT